MQEARKAGTLDMKTLRDMKGQGINFKATMDTNTRLNVYRDAVRPATAACQVSAGAHDTCLASCHNMSQVLGMSASGHSEQRCYAPWLWGPADVAVSFLSLHKQITPDG